METTAELFDIDTTPYGDDNPDELTELEGNTPIPNSRMAETVEVILGGPDAGIWVDGIRVAD